MADLTQKATEIVLASGADRSIVGAIVGALRAAYDDGLLAAREQCDVEEQDCDSEGEKRRCRNISTACLHMMYDDEAAQLRPKP